ncbi:hypothetical protein B0H66DRAFT_539826 [Apodospora peruviana]|uniref:C2H2-type domain-containing protein n=1 Tax=Apodospora peruviana TaxID=516989 RepID=A0AAE0MDW3_9PEZI|nr:hypothetical protein B0H66DRAFT_539826 [Apodospora peruviana]
MASAHTLYSSAARRDQMNEPRNLQPHDPQHYHHQARPSTPVAAGLLPGYSPRLRSSTSSPALNTATPAESESTLSLHYQSSELSESDDPFFGVNFSNIDGSGSPSFLDDSFLQLPGDEQLTGPADSQTTLDSFHGQPQVAAYLPLSPDKTPSLHTTSPNGERRGDRATFPDLVDPPELPNLVPQQPTLLASKHLNYQLTPDTSGSGQSSDDGLAPAAVIMPASSPHISVSMWGKDEVVVPYALDDEQHQQVQTSATADDTNVQYRDRSGSTHSTTRDGVGRWVPNQTTGQAGLDPDNRPSAEVPSMNQLAAGRKVEEQNQVVDGWLNRQPKDVYPDPLKEAPLPPLPADIDDNIPQREIPLGDQTENNYVPGQTYYVEGRGGELTEEDVEIMRQNRNWADAPLPFGISQPKSKHYQPPTSQAAIDKFNKLCQDNESIVSRAATWGTRRRSLPSISDFEGITSGNFLKKLSLSRGDTRRPSIKFPAIFSRQNPSASKRSRAENDDAASGSTETSIERKDSLATLAPPGRSLSWNNKNKKQPVPSINTALFAMGGHMASIGATHTRSGSISATPITSPRSPGNFSLNVMKPLNRIRSKSDLPKNTNLGLADMWKKSGGPPVANLAKPTANAAEDDDEEDEEDMYEDADAKNEANKILEDITPNFAGFQQHVVKLNPALERENNYLVDRIAHQQIIRYKSLLNSRVKHLQHVGTRSCPSGSMCIAMGGSANVIDSRGDARGLDPMSARYDVSDGDVTPLEGVISQESFPPDIPMPPTGSLPAEFECQLCFQPKKFQKPSDWTKHVHEDVQPFTCTWDRCRDPKIFKRKADWVRHENEGHRHLEWWTCDVEDCRHICYRRDNFLQHLVREHKFAEPRVKTKAAIKRMGNSDPTWQKVDQCHEETKVEPQQEPCRFCGKVFPTWKKLTVHLAKHMEQISLPILRLVARKELEADTIISPVQEPPARQFPTTFPVKTEPQAYDPSPTFTHTPMQTPMSAGQQNRMAFSHSPQHQQPPHQQQQPPYNMYAIHPTGYQPQLYSPGYEDLSQSMVNVSHGGFSSLNNTHAYSGLPVTSVATNPYIAPPNQYITVPQSDVEAFPTLSMNALGLQDQNTTAVQMPYNHMMDPHSAGGEQYTPQGSVSPYSRSPHQHQGQGHGGFYSQ